MCVLRAPENRQHADQDSIALLVLQQQRLVQQASTVQAIQQIWLNGTLVGMTSHMVQSTCLAGMQLGRIHLQL